MQQISICLFALLLTRAATAENQWLLQLENPDKQYGRKAVSAKVSPAEEFKRELARKIGRPPPPPPVSGVQKRGISIQRKGK